MKPNLSLWQIINMNVGFFGIQFSFGLQQSNMSPIYRMLGAEESALPLLWLAGPVTGLVVQPIIGAMSDRTETRWGRRTPYFLIGALICSICLIFMPMSSALWMAASLLWILDAANNVAMEPYRAFVADKLNEAQQARGFLMQSAFTGLGQTLAYITPSLLVFAGMSRDALGSNGIPTMTLTAFFLGAVFSAASILWTVFTTPETSTAAPLDVPGNQTNHTGNHTSQDSIIGDIVTALREMPLTMKQLAWMKLFQWYALFCYWQYIPLALAKSLFNTTDADSGAFREAVLINGQIGAFYNAVAFVAAFVLVGWVAKVGAKTTHAICLAAAGAGLLILPHIESYGLLFIPMIGMGMAWASIMGNPYVILAGSIPAHRVGIYMGIFNMFIVLPMIIQIATLPLVYDTLLSGNPAHVITLAGVLLLVAAGLALRIRENPQT